MRLEFHPEAELELIEAYELEIPGLGERFEAEVRRAIDLVLDHPEIGQPVDPDLRQFILPRLPFTLIYSVPIAAVFGSSYFLVRQVIAILCPR